LIRTKGGEHCELSVAEARDLGQAAARAAFAVESWQKYASGYHVLQVRRTAQGEVWVDCRGQHRTMRISTLRGSRYGRGRTCYGCHQKAVVLWVATPDPHRRKGDSRDSFPEVCEPCVERLANVPHPRGRVAP
jgi:hypothetical protein